MRSFTPRTRLPHTSGGDMRDNMNRQIEKVGSITILSITEPILDGTNAGEFKKAIKSLLDTSPRVVLDLGGVEFVDSCGCGAILTALRWLDQVGGELKVCHLTQR